MPLIDENGAPVSFADLPAITLRTEEGDGYEAWLPLCNLVCGRGNTRHQAQVDLERAIRDWMETHEGEDFVVNALPMESRPTLWDAVAGDAPPAAVDLEDGSEPPASDELEEPSTPTEQPAPTSWPVLLVIGGRWLYTSTERAAFPIHLLTARSKANGLAVEWRPDVPAAREGLEPWADRPEGVGVRQDPKLRKRLQALAGDAPKGKPDRPSAPAGMTIVRGRILWEARSPELAGQVFTGGTPAEARCKLEAALQRAELDGGAT